MRFFYDVTTDFMKTIIWKNLLNLIELFVIYKLLMIASYNWWKIHLGDVGSMGSMSAWMEGVTFWCEWRGRRGSIKFRRRSKKRREPRGLKFWRSLSGSQVFWKGIIKRFEKFTAKHLCWSLLLNKAEGWTPAILLNKKAQAQVLSCEFCEIFKKT